MKSKSRVCLSALLLIASCLLLSPGKLWAQPAAGASAAPAALDQLTGPIALYPDSLVIQILTASTNVETVTAFAGWLGQNAGLKGTELQDAAAKGGFSPPLIALALFPQVVQMMAQKPDWTKALGQAVVSDKQGVFDSIQRLRGQAMALGNLKTTPQQVVTVTNVIVEKTIEQQVVVVTNTVVQVQPANPQVVYVPTYPQTVYVQQAPPPSSTQVAGAALVGFTLGVIVANNNYNHCHYNYDNYWDAREDVAESRWTASQANQYQRQGNQEQRQSDRQSNQDERQSGRQENQGERQAGGASVQSQGVAGQAQRQPAAASAQAQTPRQSSAAPASRGGAQTASRSSGMSSGAGYQSGSATRAQSSRGNSSMSSSRGGGGGRGSGGRSGGGGGGRR